MTSRSIARLSALVAGLWAGVDWAVAFLGAPAAFAMTTSDIAGRIAGWMFLREAYLSLALSVLLIVLVRRLSREDAASTGSSIFSANLVLVMAALFFTMFGYFAVQPMMAAAKSGQGSLSFGALHGISMAMFGLKGLAITAVAWRLTAP